MTCCTTCGQVIVKPLPLSVDLNQNVIACGLTMIKVAPRIAELVWLLHRRWPACVPIDTIIEQVWGLPDVESNTVKTLTHHARVKLRPFGWTVVNDRGRGYRLAQLD